MKPDFGATADDYGSGRTLLREGEAGGLEDFSDWVYGESQPFKRMGTQ